MEFTIGIRWRSLSSFAWFIYYCCPRGRPVMTRPFIALGGKHSRDGAVTNASTIAATAGKGIARRHGRVPYPINSANQIADGNDTVVIEGAG
ncbi:hypothetical protein [Paraburkholderia agricolaris]|jgi:uncharacterized Zn-binding protein involved in type VI secretion|uniref:hypothetical protein n=1 Tax=Paraburkholderia agricolaris TaxID=2152888 RepID=UPI001C2BE53A|nr:hypothetical protein [Paraburkholderia agricolaris]